MRQVTFDDLMFIDKHLTLNVCICIFEESLGIYLWNLFERMNNTLHFFNWCDINYRTILMGWVHKDIEERIYFNRTMEKFFTNS